MKSKQLCATVVMLGLFWLGLSGCQRATRSMLRQALSPSPLQMPSELSTPAVITGADFLTKGTFVQNLKVGLMTNIALGKMEATPGADIGLAGTRGAVFVDKNGTNTASVSFNQRADNINIVDVENDGICEYLNRGSWALPAFLLDHQGKILWTYKGAVGIDDTAPGDINKDGKLDFAVGFNGGGGVSLLDPQGQEVWNKPDGNVWHVEMVDTDNDGNLEIVHSNARGQLTVRAASGNVLRRIKMPFYFSDFTLCRYPDSNSSQYALACENDINWICDYNGKVVAQFSAPSGGTLGKAKGTPVKLQAGQPSYLAVLVEFFNWNRAILYVYDSKGTLVYEEVMPETCAAIAAITLGSDSAESILVGGTDKVWSYSIGAKS